MTLETQKSGGEKSLPQWAFAPFVQGVTRAEWWILFWWHTEGIHALGMVALLPPTASW